MSSRIELTNLVEDEVFDDNELAFPPAPPSHRPTTFTSNVQELPQLPLPTAEGTPLRENRLKLAHRTEGLRTIILAFAIFSFGVTVALAIELVTGGPPVAQHGGVSSNSELCSKIGVDLLKKGGNAVDAAISTMLCIGLVRPQAAGLGGGGFMIIHDHKLHNSTLLDYREAAPKALSVSSQDQLKRGGMSVGIPGELAGMVHAHRLFGKLHWNELFIPVIKLAEDGWNLDEKDRADLKRRENDLKATNEGYVKFKDNFLLDGQRKEHRTNLAKLFRVLAVDRTEALRLFYRGNLADEITTTVHDNGGSMVKEDLSGYAVKVRKPLTSTFHDFNIVTFPAPSSGSVLIYMLNELEKLEQTDIADIGTYYARLAKITSTAYKCRALLGDPDDNAVGDHEKMLINKTLDADTYCDSAPTIPEDRGTSHVNIIDNDELMVAATSSLNYWFGSMLMTQSGILLNNEMADFDVERDENVVKPGLRPLSSMVPTIVYHKRNCLQRLTIGGTNGTKITASVAQALFNLLTKGDSLETALEYPKIFCTSTQCQLENFTNAQEVAKSINEREKLQVEIVQEKISTVSVLMKLNTTVDGYSEKSSYGKAIPY